MAYRRSKHETNPENEAIEADSEMVPAYRRMAVPYPDEEPPITLSVAGPVHPAMAQHKRDVHEAEPPITRRVASPVPSASEPPITRRVAGPVPSAMAQHKRDVHEAAGPSKDPWGPPDTPMQEAGAQQEVKSWQITGAMPRIVGPKQQAICADRFPSTYRLERTNFAVNSSPFLGNDLEVLVNTLKLAFGRAGIDVVEFRPSECTFKCSYQKGSLFLSFMVTVFLAPSQASGQLLEPHDEDGLILVEVQLREGDGLYFSGLFRDLLEIVNNQKGVTIAGTLRYQPCSTHSYGEGLALEQIMFKPAGHGPPPSGLPGMPLDAGGYPGSSPPHPASSADEIPEELDQDMTEDVMLLSGMIREGFPSVQADAASVVAGLTSTDSFRQQLSMDGASGAASALASASARLLVETPHRAARRQASVVVANLAFDPVLRAALLASDRCSSSKGTTTGSSTASGGQGRGLGVGRVAPPHSRAQAEAFSRGLLDSLVLFALGGVAATTQLAGGAGKTREEKDGWEEEEQEEEIGMRRECMRALLGMSQSEEARDTNAMKSLLLLTVEPSGQAATDKVLTDQLAACQNVLKGHA